MLARRNLHARAAAFVFGGATLSDMRRELFFASSPVSLRIRGLARSYLTVYSLEPTSLP